MSDVETKFSKRIGWTMGERTARYAMIIDHGKVAYAAKEDSPGEVTVGFVEMPAHDPADLVIGLWGRSCTCQALR